MKPKINEGNFYKDINHAISEGRHVAYLKEYIKNYEKYKNFFDKVLLEKKNKHYVFTFKVTYLLKKPVWRIFEICGCQNFDEFADAIIDSMDWDNDHMHGFSFPDPKTKVRRFGPSPYVLFASGWEDDEHPTFKTDEVKIENVDYDKYPKLGFIFDFGDGHEFDIEITGTRLLKRNEVVDEFPRLIDIRGVAPEQYPFCDEDFEFGEVSKEEVNERKIEIEKELQILLEKQNYDISLTNIKDLVLNERQEELLDIMAKFGGKNDPSKVGKVLDLAMDAWNYFPHKELGGISPVEAALPEDMNYRD